jgi:hypothetical protein
MEKKGPAAIGHWVRDGEGHYCDGVRNVAIPPRVDGDIILKGRKIDGDLHGCGSVIKGDIYADKVTANNVYFRGMSVGFAYLNPLIIRDSGYFYGMRAVEILFKDGADVGYLSIVDMKAITLNLKGTRIRKLDASADTMIDEVRMDENTRIDKFVGEITVGGPAGINEAKIPENFHNALGTGMKRFKMGVLKAAIYKE